MKTKLTQKQVRYAINQCSKERSTKDIAEELGVTRRRIQQLWAVSQDGHVSRTAQARKKEDAADSRAGAGRSGGACTTAGRRGAHSQVPA